MGHGMLTGAAVAAFLTGCALFTPSGYHDSFLPEDISRVMNEPDQVTAMKLQSGPGQNNVRVLEDFGEIPLDRAQVLTRLALNPDNHVPELQKQCRFRPLYRVEYKQNNETVELLLDTTCRMWRFKSASSDIFEDYDPALHDINEWLAGLEEKR